MSFIGGAVHPIEEEGISEIVIVARCIREHENLVYEPSNDKFIVHITLCLLTRDLY